MRRTDSPLPTVRGDLGPVAGVVLVQAIYLTYGTDQN